MTQANEFVNKIKAAELQMMKDTLDEVKKEPEADVTENGSEKGPKLEIKENNSAIDSADFVTIKDRFEQDTKIRKLEGKGVRLPLSEDSENTVKPKALKLLEEKDTLTACTEYEKKFDKKHRSGVI